MNRVHPSQFVIDNATQHRCLIEFSLAEVTLLILLCVVAVELGSELCRIFRVQSFEVCLVLSERAA